MTGPEHYRRAEQLIEGVIKEVKCAEAHIHALLALAAATAVRTQADQEAWISVAATKPPNHGGPEPPNYGGPVPAKPAGMP
jgi:hypothetical protein